MATTVVGDGPPVLVAASADGTTDEGGSSSSADGAGAGAAKAAGAADAASTSPAVQGGLLGRVTGAINGGIRSFFNRVGYLVAGRPLWFILGSLMLTAGLTAGVLRLRTESRGNKLWVPQGTCALRDQAVVEAELGQFVRAVQLIATSANGGGDVATVAGLRGLLALQRAAEEVTAEVDGGQVVTYLQLCCRRFDEVNNSVCATTSVLGAFYDSASAIKHDDGAVNFTASVAAGLDGLSDAQVKARLTADGEFVPAFDGGDVQRSVVLGATAGEGSALTAQALYLGLLLRNDQVVKDGEGVDFRAEAWEEAWSRRLLFDNSPDVAGAEALD